MNCSPFSMPSLEQLDACQAHIWEGECKTDRSAGMAGRLTQEPSPRLSSSCTCDTLEASPALTFSGSPVMTPRSSGSKEFCLNFEEIVPDACEPAEPTISPLKARRCGRASLHQRRRGIVSSTLTLDSVAQESTSSPETPRGAPETPRTPKAKAAPRSHSPPCLVPKSRISLPPLLKALTANSIGDVRAALKQNPTAAQEPFWDHDLEPPLCAAVRLHCSADIVKLLLDLGADPEATDVRGQGPLETLKQPQRGGQVDPTMDYEPTWVQMMSDDIFADLVPDGFGTSSYFAAQESCRQEVSVLLAQATVAAF